VFRATDNKRLKELVSVELLFFNSNIQLLKEEVSDLNSSVQLYQPDKYAQQFPDLTIVHLFSYSEIIISL